MKFYLCNKYPQIKKKNFFKYLLIGSICIIHNILYNILYKLNLIKYNENKIHNIKNKSIQN